MPPRRCSGEPDPGRRPGARPRRASSAGRETPGRLLTLRFLNLRELVSDDFEGGERGLLLKPDALKTYLGLYEGQLRSESEGAGTPTWRQRLSQQVDALREMVMAGEPTPVYTWSDG